MSNATLIKIINISSQLITIVISSIEDTKANTDSSVPPNKEGVYHMIANSELTIELQRINVNQLNQLSNLGQIKIK